MTKRQKLILAARVTTELLNKKVIHVDGKGHENIWKQGTVTILDASISSLNPRRFARIWISTLEDLYSSGYFNVGSLIVFDDDLYVVTQIGPGIGSNQISAALQWKRKCSHATPE